MSNVSFTETYVMRTALFDEEKKKERKRERESIVVRRTENKGIGSVRKAGLYVEVDSVCLCVSQPLCTAKETVSSCIFTKKTSAKPHTCTLLLETND